MREILEKILPEVTKPARYAGGELNEIVKEDAFVRFAFAFPDIYEVGMSHLGMKILYHIINSRDNWACERVFAPWTDMEKKMCENGLPLFSLETKTPFGSFDLVGFTLQYEMSYTNVLNMLKLGGIPLFAADRSDGPFVIGGGPCAFNPEPLAPFFDIFVIGDGEEATVELIEAFEKWKKAGAPRREFLLAACRIPGVYVPAFYDVCYNENGTVKSVSPNTPEAPEKITKRVFYGLDGCFPEKIIVPHIGIVHDRIMLEIFRGCTRGCRFCQAGYIYRPVRERTRENLVSLAKRLVSNTGYNEISLSSLSSGDYSELEALIGELMECYNGTAVSLSLPSLRIDSYAKDYAEQLAGGRKSGLTFAPEAGTQRLRDVINKGVTEEDLIGSAGSAFDAGWNSVKLYFMLGLPGETDEDLLGIANMAAAVVRRYYEVPKEKRARGLKVTVSVSTFVPKPFTPFQWSAQDTVQKIEDKQRLLRGALRQKAVEFNWHDSRTSFLEAVFARGDRRLANVLAQAVARGCKMDGWQELFNFEAWMAAFDACGLDPAFYANRERSFTEVLPYDHIDAGVSKAFLISEMKKAQRGETTADCRLGCRGCGLINCPQALRGAGE